MTLHMWAFFLLLYSVCVAHLLGFCIFHCSFSEDDYGTQSADKIQNSDAVSVFSRLCPATWNNNESGENVQSDHIAKTKGLAYVFNSMNIWHQALLNFISKNIKVFELERDEKIMVFENYYDYDATQIYWFFLFIPFFPADLSRLWKLLSLTSTHHQFF